MKISYSFSLPLSRGLGLALPSFALLAACGGDPAPAKTPTTSDTASTTGGAASSAPMADAPKKPELKLAETPADKLGTEPAGFGLKVGDKAPDATLADITGQKQSLAALYAQKPTFVVFYRGGWCPFCNLQLHDLSTAKPEFDARGVQVVAISVDLPTEEAKTQAKQGVPFPMLSDPKLVALTAFKVVHVPSDAEHKALTGFGVNLTAYSGESHGNFAVPSVFLVDKTGTIRFAHVDEDFKTRPSAKELLAVADRTLTK